MYKFVIPGELTSLNKYIKAERGNRYGAAKLKQINTEKVFISILDNFELRNRQFKSVYLKINYYVKNRRTDKDNIAFCKKFIFDGMQKAGVIKNDGWDNIRGWDEYFNIDRDNPRIEIEVIS